MHDASSHTSALRDATLCPSHGLSVPRVTCAGLQVGGSRTYLRHLSEMRFSVTGALLARGGKRPYTDGPAGPFVYRLGREIFNLERRVRLP
jgi:hypothetical protein